MEGDYAERGRCEARVWLMGWIALSDAEMGYGGCFRLYEGRKH